MTFHRPRLDPKAIGELEREPPRKRWIDQPDYMFEERGALILGLILLPFFLALARISGFW